MSENSNKTNSNSIAKNLFNSFAVNSLRLETMVYDSFKKLKWNVEHSPYYKDPKTEKLREVDVTARKYWRSPKEIDLSCAIEFIVECKTLKDYHIVVSERRQYKFATHLIHRWIGEDSYNNYARSKNLLSKHHISKNLTHSILKKLDKFCFPNITSRFVDYYLEAFDIPTFNSFRETNIGTTKDLDNSVVWKAFQSLYSCIENFDSLIWEGIDYTLYDVGRKKLSTQKEKANELLSMLLTHSKHVIQLHPLLVVESNLWEISNSRLKKLKYLRLTFQKMFEDEIWIDIVNKEYLDEYLKKTLEYDKTLERKKFSTRWK